MSGRASRAAQDEPVRVGPTGFILHARNTILSSLATAQEWMESTDFVSTTTKSVENPSSVPHELKTVSKSAHSGVSHGRSSGRERTVVVNGLKHRDDALTIGRISGQAWRHEVLLA